MDKYKKDLFELFKLYGYGAMREMKLYRETQNSGHLFNVCLNYEYYYDILYGIIRKVRNKC
jgi:hypothetical protein